MKEEWRPCFHGLYAVSNLGRVRREAKRRGAKVGRIRKPITIGGWYPTIVLWDGCKQTQIAVHRLVAAAFIGPRPLGHEVNHKNGIKTDNRAENLEYVTPSQNMLHAVRLGLLKPKGLPGELNHQSKLTSADVLDIRSRRAVGEPVSSVAALYAIHKSTVIRVAKRRVWRHIP